MPLMRWDPFTALSRLDDEFDDLVRRSFGAKAAGPGQQAPTFQYVPAVEMATDGADVLITLELPGVDVADIDIEVADGRLTISGERKDRWEDNRGKVLVRELRYGAFRRMFQLPDGVGADQVEASAENGLLSLRVRNVTKPVQPPRKIQVRGTEQSQPRTIESTAGDRAAGNESTGKGQISD
jgi:HSP20 family protein